ncbi:MAG: hypothetical protein AAFQ02_09095 [Bacteroidota bacterium]
MTRDKVYFILLIASLAFVVAVILSWVFLPKDIGMAMLIVPYLYGLMTFLVAAVIGLITLWRVPTLPNPTLLRGLGSGLLIMIVVAVLMLMFL